MSFLLTLDDLFFDLLGNISLFLFIRLAFLLVLQLLSTINVVGLMLEAEVLCSIPQMVLLVSEDMTFIHWV